MHKIALIGAGNVGWHLAHALAKVGHLVTDIYSKKMSNAVALSDYFVGAIPTDSLDFSKSEAKIYLVAVSDDALKDVLNELKVQPEAIVAHTSGTQGIDIISQSHAAVFYPLQTFSKSKEVDFQEVSFCLEAKDTNTLAVLKNLASTMSQKIYEFNSQERQLLHLAAVFSCNFSNFLFTISKHLLEKNEQAIPFDILKPLVSEMVGKAFDILPENAQTGPAKRGDNSIIDKQLALLSVLFDEKTNSNDKGESEWKNLYELFSRQIRQYYMR